MHTMTIRETINKQFSDVTTLLALEILTSSEAFQPKNQAYKAVRENPTEKLFSK